MLKDKDKKKGGIGNYIKNLKKTSKDYNKMTGKSVGGGGGKALQGHETLQEAQKEMDNLKKSKSKGKKKRNKYTK